MDEIERLKTENAACEKLILSLLSNRTRIKLPLSVGRYVEIEYPTNITESELRLLDRGVRLFRDSLTFDAPVRFALGTLIEAQVTELSPVPLTDTEEKPGG